jgi:hypothetical protein
MEARCERDKEFKLTHYPVVRSMSLKVSLPVSSLSLLPGQKIWLVLELIG